MPVQKLILPCYEKYIEVLLWSALSLWNVQSIPRKVLDLSISDLSDVAMNLFLLEQSMHKDISIMCSKAKLNPPLIQWERIR